jgi:hypothetical protein
MLASEKINEIVAEVAIANLTPSVVRYVMSEPTTDSGGEEALRITIVIAPGTVELVSGDAVLDTLVMSQDRLRDAGEERLPIVGYAAEDELDEVGDP